MPRKPTDAQARAAAKERYERDGEIEVDDNAKISRMKGNGEKGCYVQAWVWIYDEDARKDAQ